MNITKMKPDIFNYVNLKVIDQQIYYPFDFN